MRNLPRLGKPAFHSQACALARKVAKDLGIKADIRSNKGGPAVLGEVMLHGDSLYVQFSRKILFRSCEGRKDYTGGRNHWAAWDWEYEKLLAEFREVMRPMFEVFNG